MKYVIESRKTKIDFDPWFKKGYRMSCLHLYEEIGELATGWMDLELCGNADSLSILNTQYTGKLTIEVDGGNVYNIDVFITDRKYFKNNLSINFVCIKDPTFIRDHLIEAHTDITGTIQKLYPGNQDIRCETDIQDTEMKFYQSHQTNKEFLSDLCLAFKKESIFAFGWEGLLIKEIIGKDSQGNQEPKLFTTGDASFEHKGGYKEIYDPNLYNLSYNPWEDTEAKHIPKDYTEQEAENIRAVTKYKQTYYMNTPYVQVLENREYNKMYYGSNFQVFNIVDQMFPKYKLGDVIGYKRNEQTSSNSPTWLNKWYLVRSNELFVSSDKSNKVDARGLKFSFLTSLVALEKDGSFALGKDIDDDPTKKES